jgi:hypothetical protein
MRWFFERRGAVKIVVQQVQTLLDHYRKEKMTSLTTSWTPKSKEEATDKVTISLHAKRLQVYDQTAKDVLSRLQKDVTDF